MSVYKGNVKLADNSATNSTTYWVTNKIGDTITIPDVSGATLVNVYKNGHLLEQGTKINGYKYTGGDGKWIDLAQTAPISNANSWSIQAKFKTGSSHGEYGGFFGISGTVDNKCPSVNYRGNTNSLTGFIGSTGTSWDIVSGPTTSYSLDNNTDYYLGLVFTGTSYVFLAKRSYEYAYTHFYSVNSNTKCHCSVPWQLLCALNNTSVRGTLYMPTLQVVIDGETWFDGATAVKGTDYINNNCTEEEYNTTTNDYAIDGNNLIFTEPITPFDVIALEVF